jgi:hypothetical protein
MAALPPDEVAGLLRRRLDALDAEVAARREALARDRAEVPRLFLLEVEYDVAILAAEAGWVRALLAELTDGTMSGLPEWRGFHETGHLPDDLIQLAERSVES